jgi:hypothetical protein
MLRFMEHASSTLYELLKEVPRKELTWTTYLGHLYSKGSAIAESQDRDKYGEIGRLWYSKACEIDPTEGSIYLCLAIHSTNVLQKHFHYSQAICTFKPYPRGQGLFAALFNSPGLSPLVSAFLRAHGDILENRDALQSTNRFLELLGKTDIKAGTVTYSRSH